MSARLGLKDDVVLNDQWINGLMVTGVCYHMLLLFSHDYESSFHRNISTMVSFHIYLQGLMAPDGQMIDRLQLWTLTARKNPISPYDDNLDLQAY